MLIRGNKIVSVGVNKAKSDPIQKIYSETHKSLSKYYEYSWLHAEIDCLKGFNDLQMDFKKTTLFIIRVDRDGHLKESCPCVGCMTRITELKIPRIIHSTASGGIVEILKRDY